MQRRAWPLIAIGAAASLQAGCCLPYLPGANHASIEVWRSDGTPAGTTRISKLPIILTPRQPLAVVGRTLIFGVDEAYQQDWESSVQLWKSDGTASGTVRITYISKGGIDRPGPVSPLDSRSVVLGSNLLFIANDLVHGSEIWRTDGSAAGTVPVQDRGGRKPPPSNLVAVGDAVYYYAKPGPNLPRGEVWRTDGTSRGTSLLSKIESPSACLVGFQGSLFFTAAGALWRSDGSPGGEVRLKALNEDAEGCERAQPHVVDRTLFIATTHELWKSDGTAAGTVLVKKFKPGLSLWAWRAPVHVGGTLFFHLQGAGIMQLWRSDGTDSGTTLLAEDAPHSLGMAIFPLGQKLLLALEDREHGRELWTSDGTAAGTRLLVDLRPGPEGSWPQGFVEFGDRALFGATTPRDDVPFDPRASLWSTDGTTAGTRRIATQVGSAEMARMGRFVYWIRPI